MSAVLLDTNVIVDLLKADPQWMPWTARQIVAARAKGALCINIVVYAELCAHSQTQSQIDGFLKDAHIELRHLGTDSALSAAQAFYQYRSVAAAKRACCPIFS